LFFEIRKKQEVKSMTKKQVLEFIAKENLENLDREKGFSMLEIKKDMFTEQEVIYIKRVVNDMWKGLIHPDCLLDVLEYIL
jgi:hypothetical protein